MLPRVAKINHCVISFSATLVRIVIASERHRGDLKLATYLLNLPKGCINEVTGEVEDPSFILRFLESINISQQLKPRSLLSLKPEITIILPTSTCYHLTIPVDESDKTLDTQELVKRYSKSLPGDATKLISSGYANPKALSFRAKRELSIFAARECAVLGYTRLLGENICQIQSVIPPQVACFNRILLERSEVISDCILNLDTTLQRHEITLWDSGVIVASENRAEIKDRLHGDSSKRVGVEFIGEQPEIKAKDVLRFLAKPELVGRSPSEVIITGGDAKIEDLVKRLGDLLRLPVSQSLNQGILAGYRVSFNSNESVTVISEVFADLLGVITPKYREINLLPPSIKERRSGIARIICLARPLICAAVCVLVSFLLSTITALFSCQGMGSEILKAKERLAELRSSISAGRGDLVRLKDAKRIADSEGLVVAESLASLDELTPSAVTVSSIVVDKRQLVITGVARDRAQVSELVDRIGNSANLKGVQNNHPPSVTVERVAFVELEGLSLQEFVVRAVFVGDL
jgi:hypothetical protein